MKKKGVKSSRGQTKEESSSKRGQTKGDKESVVHPNTIFKYFKKLNTLFFKPSKLLKSIEKESLYKTSMIFYIATFFIYNLIIAMISLASGTINIFGFIISLIWAIIVPLILSFLISGIIHLGVKVMKGKQGYFNTYKIITYALAIGIIYSFISLIVVYLVPFNAFDTGLIQETADIGIVKQIYKDFIVQPGAIINLLISLIMMIHILCFSIKGLSKYQKITNFKSGMAIILPWIVFVLVVAVLLILMGLAVGNVGV